MLALGRLGIALGLIASCNSSVLYGPPTESVCPPTSTLTYAGFGQPFMQAYCVQCHSSTLMGPDRHGAPLLHDFDTLYGIEPFTNHIDWTTASGPAATNTAMPTADPRPSLEERKMLGEWLACGVP